MTAGTGVPPAVTRASGMRAMGGTLRRGPGAAQRRLICRASPGPSGGVASAPKMWLKSQFNIVMKVRPWALALPAIRERPGTPSIFPLNPGKSGRASGRGLGRRPHDREPGHPRGMRIVTLTTHLDLYHRRR